jgi:EmrB/QacA subfamily drug resistance transporter
VSARLRASERPAGATFQPTGTVSADLELPLATPFTPGASRPPARASRRTVHRPPRRPRAAAAASRPRPTPIAAAPAVPAAGGWLLPLGIVVVGSFMALLDTSIVNVATPTIQAEFGASTDQVQWIATAYTLVLGIVVPTSGWLGDRFGLRRIYIISMLGFAAGSALCGLAWNLNSLILFRVVQALGGGLLPVVAQAMVYRIVPRDRIGAAMGLYGLGIVVAPALGPTLGGWLVQDVSWRLIFYINVPIAILGAFAALSILPRFSTRPGQRFDLLGFGFIAAGLFSLLLALSEGSSWGWTSYRVLMLIAAGLFSLAVFVVVELSVEQPLLDVRVFRNGNFAISAVLIALLSTGLFSGAFYIPLFLQQGEGFGALQAGVTMLLPALVMAALMPLSGRLYDRVGARWPGAVGILLLALGTYLMHAVTPQTARLDIILWNAVRSLGIGLSMMPIMTGSMAAIPMHRVGQASAVNNLVQRVSGALGLAVLTSVLTRQQAQQVADQAALVHASPGFPQLQDLAAHGQTALLALYGAVQTQAFSGGLGDVFLLTAGLTAVGVLLALLLPAGPARRRAPAVQPASVDDGEVAVAAHEIAA